MFYELSWSGNETGLLVNSFHLHKGIANLAPVSFIGLVIFCRSSAGSGSTAVIISSQTQVLNAGCHYAGRRGREIFRVSSVTLM